MVIFLMFVLEGSCRLFGFPRGTFATIFTDTGSDRPYRPNEDLELQWGPITYYVQSNSLGFRGDEIAETKREGTLRLLTIGDSITDNFFVDNADTWQKALRRELEDLFKREVEVVNGARGGASIDKELDQVRRFTPLLNPDLVVLSFVTNDIAGLNDLTLDEVLGYRPPAKHTETRNDFQKFLITRTALGEFLFHAYLSLRSSSYRRALENADQGPEDIRYLIEGGQDYEENIRKFRMFETDGLVLDDHFSNSTENLFALYVRGLEEFAAVCRAEGAEFLFVYFPGYSQVYDKSSPLYVNDRLRGACDSLGIDFLDMTEGFRKKGDGRVLHLAPLDFHLNPSGNQVFAEIIAEHLGGDGPLSIRIREKYAFNPSDALKTGEMEN
jgi:lysophospholipase L1-like esterase